MNNFWPLVIFGLFTIYFGGKTLQIIPTFFELLVALNRGLVKWPGPRIHHPNRHASNVRERLGIGYDNLFPIFFINASGVFASFVFSLLTFISKTPLMSGTIRTNWPLAAIILYLIAYAGGMISAKRVRRNVVQVNTILTDLASNAEPRAVDGLSAEAEYAIEHPLIGQRNLPHNSKIAVDQFYESVRCHQDGDKRRALSLYQEALQTDPALHQTACTNLSKMAQDCSSSAEGAIFYWLGIHSEWLIEWGQAATAYEKATKAFIQIGHLNRASRAANNLGNTKMRMGDPSAMDEFEKAIALNPKNGTAYINIGTTYYRISMRGDSRFEQALDAFAAAVTVDPTTYGPTVMSRLRTYGYTWREDWEDVRQRVARRHSGTSGITDKRPNKPAGSPDSRKQRIGFKTNSENGGEKTSLGSQKKEIGSETNTPVKKPKKKYRNKKHGFAIDMPEEWHRSPIPVSGTGTKDFFQYGCYNEAFNFEIGPLHPEPPLHQTERDFVQFAMFSGFSELKFDRITVAGKEHVCASYRIKDDQRERWNKKYIIVFRKTEYTITATCDAKDWFLQREQEWDEIVQSFRLLNGAR